MRYIIVLISAMAVLAFACGGEKERSGSTVTPLASPEATSTGESGGMEGFRTLATEIERAIAQNDSQFFIERAVLQSETCPDEPQEFGPCAGQPAGAIVTGIPSGIYQSDAGGFLQPEDFAKDIPRYAGAALTERTDAYGGGAVALYALARSEDGTTEVFHAITTSIVDTYPTGYPIGSVEREAHIFSFQFQDGRWRFTRMGAAVVSLSSSDWLSGQCAECYQDWERWPASPLARDAAAAATAVAGRGGFPTAQEAIAAYGEAWFSPFAPDCEVIATPPPQSCLAADRDVGETEATYRLCRAGTALCLLVTLARGDDGSWNIASVDAYGEGPGPTEEVVP